jgi:hypothetical protein
MLQAVGSSICPEREKNNTQRKGTTEASGGSSDVVRNPRGATIGAPIGTLACSEESIGSEIATPSSEQKKNVHYASISYEEAYQ